MSESDDTASRDARGGSWAGLPPQWNAESWFDGGDTGCGEMILDLSLHFRPLPAGTRVAVRAQDEGAPIEIPAWCRITGHVLRDAAHPFYLVQVRPASGPDDGAAGGNPSSAPPSL